MNLFLINVNTNQTAAEHKLPVDKIRRNSALNLSMCKLFG